jgi:regulatory protein
MPLAGKSLRKAGSGDSWGVALRLLTRRDYSTGELRQRLLDKGFPADAADAAVARGLALGYLDDARLIARQSRALLAQGRAAGPRLTLELRRRGFPRELIDDAVQAACGEGAEAQALRELIERRFASFDFAGADERERRRVVAFLQRRGFPLDRILNELKRTDS